MVEKKEKEIGEREVRRKDADYRLGTSGED